MKSIASHHPFGVVPHYFTEDGRHAPRIRELHPRDWDLDGVSSYLNRAPSGRRTCFKDIQPLAPGEELWSGDGGLECRAASPSPTAAPLLPVLETALLRILAEGRKAAVALSGGLDSALVVALIKKLGRDDVPVVTLATKLSGYCELAETRRTAAALGVKDLLVIEANAEDLIHAFPAAITAAEVPLFNLHPVSRWLLAQALHRQGIEVLITGDGADQVFAGSDGRNYLPIVGALVRESGLKLNSPFFDEDVIAAAPPATADKAALRAAAEALLPPEILNRPKTARYAPALDVSRHWHGPAIAGLAARMRLTLPEPGSSPEATLWTSLGILAQLLN